MDNRPNGIIWAVAIGQFIPVLLYPPGALAAASVAMLALPLLFFLFLAYSLLRKQMWAKTLTIFLQGFNIIVRMMLVISHGAAPLKRGGALDWPLLITCLVAIVLSGLILVRFDVPEVDLAFT